MNLTAKNFKIYVLINDFIVKLYEIIVKINDSDIMILR